MSGIIGIASTGNALPNVLLGLQQLAHGGPQHCGLVVHGRQGQTPSPPRLHRHRRTQGVAAWLEQMRAHQLNGLQGCMAIGHIGLAGGTGTQTLQQTQPHLSHGPHADLNSPARVAVVLHGPLQASTALREALLERDYSFKTESDAELLAHLIDATGQNDLVQGLHRALNLVHGPICASVLFHNQPHRVFVVQRGTSLHVAAGADLMAWSNHADALPTALQPLPSWPEGHVIEVHTSPQGVTHRVHSLA